MPVVANTRHSMNGDRLSTATETGIGAVADTVPPDVARRDDVSTSNRCINFHTYVILGGMILSTQLDEGLNYCTNGFVTFVFWLRLVTKHSIPDAKKLLTFWFSEHFIAQIDSLLRLQKQVVQLIALRIKSTTVEDVPIIMCINN